MAIILGPTSDNIKIAAAKIKSGGLVAFATETVYGLGANAYDANAVLNIYKTKERPAFNPLIIHYSNLADIEKDAVINENFIKLFEKFSPGPLSYVLPKSKSSKVCDIATAGLKTVAIRVPKNNVALDLIKECCVPLAAPSANPSGSVSPISAKNVEKMLGDKIEFILDGGECKVGLESTIIDLSGATPAILRQGTITKEQIEKVIGKLNIHDENSDKAPKAPGMSLKHYAPKCGLRLSQQNPIKGEALLCFGKNIDTSGFDIVLNLSETDNLDEAAKNLFKFLHQLDEMNVTRISATLLPETGIGVAINDKLRRGAE